ncbi:MAG: hypothetical protein AB8B55_19770 [Mariniblastus sp.]
MPSGPKKSQPAIPAGSDRAGSAPLELVLAMPILLSLIVAIVWLGSSVIAQTEVTIEARHKTWSKRDESTGTALLFLKDDIVTDKATKTVEVSPLFDDAESPESSHAVMAGPWDHEKLPLDKAPNWKQYALAATNAKTGSIQNGYTDARNQLSQFKNEAGNIWQTIGASMIRQLTNLGDSVSSALEGGQSNGDREKAKDKSRLNRAIATKKAELNKAKEELDNLDDESSKALKLVLENRVKRLKAEVADLESDLEALE